MIRTLWSKYSVVVAFVVIFVAASILSPNFLTQGNLLNILSQVAITGIIALGQTVVILAGGLDLSVGSVLALVGAVGLMCLNASGSGLVAILATLAGGLVAGAINGLLVAKARITPFIATLATMAMARSVILYMAQGGTVSGNIESYSNIGMGSLFGLSYPTYIFVIATVVMFLVLHWTRFGRYVYAIGSNERAARLSGIRVDRIKMWTYVVCGTLTGLAAVIESSRLDSISSSSSGINYELDSIAAVVIGGTRLAGGKGSIAGTFVGVLIMEILNNLINLLNVSPYLQGFVKGAIIIAAVLLQRREA